MSKDITIVCVSTIHHEQINFNFKTTAGNTPNVKDIIFFSNKPVSNCNTFIKLKDNFSYDDYNTFILKNLSFHVNTEYVLIIQPDSMAISKELWDDNFFMFDYIGAETEVENVYNGGFSLRSKKLLEALLDPEVKVLEGLRQGRLLTYKEDVIITKYYRHFLEEFYNIKFCDTLTARKFSTDITHNSNSCFGFHGAHNSLKHMEFDKAVNFITTLHGNTNKWPIYQNLISNYKHSNFECALEFFRNDLKNQNLFDRLYGEYA